MTPLDLTPHGRSGGGGGGNGTLPPDMHNDDAQHHAPPPGGGTLIDKNTVIALTGLTRHSLLTVEKTDPTFPKRVVVTKSVVRWYREEVVAWVAARPRGVGHVDKPVQLVVPGKPAPRNRNRRPRGSA